MSRICVSTTVDVPPADVWAVVEDISSHVTWMQDATDIRFDTAQTSGAGTTFVCDTKVGPLRLEDHMEITRWEPGRAMGVRHVGLVTGSGVFELRPVGGGRRTEFVWTEHLTFPWWLGGPVGSFLARPVFGRIWRANLRNLKAIVEHPDSTAPTG